MRLSYRRVAGLLIWVVACRRTPLLRRLEVAQLFGGRLKDRFVQHDRATHEGCCSNLKSTTVIPNFTAEISGFG